MTCCADPSTFSDVPSENVEQSIGDRRTRKREARRDHLLDLAAELVAAGGVEAVTMAALAEAADYATASLYTYFASRSELMAALQHRALVTLGQVGQDHLALWNASIYAADPPVPADVAALARLWAFSDLFLTAPQHHPHEFRLQQQLLVNPGLQETADAATVVPQAMYVLDVPRQLLTAAVEAGALEPAEPPADPLVAPIDGAIARTLAWVVALNGALLTENLTTGLPTTPAVLGHQLTQGLLRGWGARPAPLATARALADAWATDHQEPS